uniref:ATP synthase complex subunit 8 n=1 Tax=Tullbergia mixta TaxID=1499077 RepID=A0A7T7BW22_9HEXA|nr:ATP synthase F0 subunit 8 [Tullbergia mixta]QQK54721.1 ATP synthase F0 subunit 8 [Tullbergia mixta]
MPQMAPMSWLLLLLSSAGFFALVAMKLYYMSPIAHDPQAQDLAPNYACNSLNWKW